MEDLNKLCLGCMKKKDSEGKCPYCGFDINEYNPPLHHLRTKTILNGKYWIGKAIGEGGFGITYTGWDLNLEIKVAIKEYFPNGFVSRDVSNTDTLTVFSGSDRENYEKGRKKFIEEAKALAKFENLPGIVSVKDFFLENGTAYIVMEFIEGETLKEFLKRNGGKTLPENIFEMMRPLMKSLIEVHKKGIIHRDISPDNIMITGNSEVKLLDFGAARDISGNNKSLSIQLKPGYAPEEQYRSHGNQGPWTDVYALCATMYRAITGKTPIESLERIQNDTLIRPSQMGIQIDIAQENAIMQGMSVFAKDRFQSIEALYNALYNSDEKISNDKGNGVYNIPPSKNTYTGSGYNKEPTQTGIYQQPNFNSPQNQYPQQRNDNGIKIALIIMGAVIVVVATVIAVLLFSGLSDKDTSPTSAPAVTSTPQPTVPPAPVFTSVSATSTRGTDYTSGVGINYYPEYAIDGDYTTAWSSDRNIELTPTITLSSSTKQHVTGIKLANGYFKNENTYTRNRRITKVLVEYEGGSKIQDLDINQYRVMQDIKFDAPADTSYISIKVLESYYGDWKDIAISEIEVY